MLPKRSPALRLAILYLLVSAAWILLSDRLVLRLIGNNIERLQLVQSVKGILFVGFCSTFLYFVSRRYYRGLTKALSKTEDMLHRYQGLSEASKEGVSDHDLRTDTALLNEQMRYFMQEPSNEVGDFQERHRKRIHPGDLDRVVRNYNETLATSSTLWQADFRYLLHDGEYHDVTNRGFILRDARDQPLRMIYALQDVSELRNIRTAIYHQNVKHQLKLGQSIIDAQEQERHRWSTELHDNVCQILTVVKLYLEQVEEHKGDGVLIHKAGEMTTKALNDIRQLSASIRPPEFKNTTLHQALDDLLASVERVKSYRISTDLDHLDETRLLDEQKMMIYRVVQEQLSNILKYADASSISIVLKTEAEEVLIEVTDDGRGFDMGQATGGIGLKNIRSRLEVFSGSLTVEAALGKGCKLMARFSLV